MKKRFLFLPVATLVLLLLLTSCSGGDAEERSATVTVNKKGSELTVTVKPAEQLAETYRGEPLYLFALEPGKDDSNLYAEQPVTEKKSGTSVTYRLPLYGNGISRLYYSFTAAYYDTATNEYVKAIKSPVYVTNPEILAQNTSAYNESRTIKGISTVYDAEAVMLGAGHVVIEIPVENYLLAEGTETAIPFIYGGKSCYVDRDSIETLDKRVKYYTENDVCVYFRFILKTEPSKLKGDLSCLACPGAVPGADYYPFNMADTRCAAYMTGFLDFMAERYTRNDGLYGFCGNFIAGTALNTPGKGSGAMTTATNLAASSVLVRSMYTALASHYSNGRAYVTVDRNWRTKSSYAADDTGYGFLNAFAEKARNEGDYPWCAAASIRAASSSSDCIWYDDSGDGAYLTPSSLGNLTGAEFLSASSILYKGEVRHAIVSDFSIDITSSAGTEELQAASYAYAYYKALDFGGIDALIYSNHIDTAASKSGLRQATSEGKPGGTRRIYYMFGDIDTDADINTSVSASIRDNSWATYYSNNRVDAQINASRTGSAFVGVHAEDYSTSPLYTFDGGTVNGFAAVGIGSYSGLVPNGGASSLKAVLPRAETSSLSYLSRRGITKKDISQDSLLITFSVQAAPGNPQLQSYDVALTLVQKNSKKGDVVYSSMAQGITAGNTVTVEFDVSSFREALNSGDIEMRLTATGGDGLGCSLRLDSILSGKIQKNTWLIILLIILASLAVVALATVGIIWFRKNYTIDMSVFSKSKKSKKRKSAGSESAGTHPRPSDDANKREHIKK